MFDATPPRPPFDPEIAPVMGAFIVHRTLETLPELRRQQANMEIPDLTAGGAVRVDDVTVPGPEGDPDIKLAVLHPTAGEGPWPAIYQIHGGGLTLGTRWALLDQFIPYVTEIGVVVVSVEYRLAPDHPDPAPVEDCYAGLVWVSRHADELHVDPSRIMISGNSAGGCLAAGTALLCRDRGYPKLTHQILGCPMLDDRCETASAKMLDGEGVWDRNDNLFGWNALLGERRGRPDVSVYTAPARETNLTGLPKTYIDVGSVDTMRDEAISYARQLSEAGVSVDFHLWGGGAHGFETWAPDTALSRAARAARDEFIRRALTTDEISAP
jgi:acetyl esterase/lipase